MTPGVTVLKLLQSNFNVVYIRAKGGLTMSETVRFWLTQLGWGFFLWLLFRLAFPYKEEDSNEEKN